MFEPQNYASLRLFRHSYQLLRNAQRQRKCIRRVILLRLRFHARKHAARHNQLVRASRLADKPSP